MKQTPRLRLARHLPLLLAAGLGLLLAGCQKPPPPLRVALNAWPPYEFLSLAQAKGFFREAGVEVKLSEFNSLSDARRAFEAGKVDGWAATQVEVLMARDNSPRDARIVQVLDFSDGADVILATRDIASVRDLRGKRVGVEVASVGVYVLGRALESAGLQLADVTPVAGDQATLAEKLRRGELAAVVSYAPESIRTLADGRFHALFSSQSLPGEVVDVLAFDQETLRQRPAQVAAFRQALARAFEFYGQQPAEACRIMGEREGLSAEEFQRALTDGIRLVAPADQSPYFQAGGALSKALEAAARHLRAVKLLSDRPAVTEALPPP